MPPRSKVYGLPAELKTELDRRLLASGFGDYVGLESWLDEQGYRISKSALHAYGSGLEDDFARTMGEVQRTQQLAQAYAESNPDQRSALTGATVRIAQESLLRITLALRQAEEDPAHLARVLPNITRALADLGRLDISREKWAAEREEELKRQGAAAALEQYERTAKEVGVSQEAIERIRREVLGMAA